MTGLGRGGRAGSCGASVADGIDLLLKELLIFSWVMGAAESAPPCMPFFPTIRQTVACGWVTFDNLALNAASSFGSVGGRVSMSVLDSLRIRDTVSGLIANVLTSWLGSNRLRKGFEVWTLSF